MRRPTLAVLALLTMLAWVLVEGSELARFITENQRESSHFSQLPAPPQGREKRIAQVPSSIGGRGKDSSSNRTALE